ncbi:hypothetical protein SC127_17285 [Pantoea sp. T14]|jgi:hypothetical protein|uniref:hypothetical protein n=1 Tax=Pantoea TaxID=53335 RepID=UPI002FCA1570
MLQLSIVHRLPQRFRWVSDHHSAIEADDGVTDEQDIIALRLISHDGHPAWEILHQLKEVLAAIQVDGKVAECEGQPCLFIQRSDESATNCCLKNQGVAIAETFHGH